MSFMNKMMEQMMGRMDKEKKQDMMKSMMPKMMKDMEPGDMMGMMSEMMPKMMESMGGGDMMDMMHENMPKMMENGLTNMSQEERQKMFSFCHKMLGEMEDKFMKRT